MHFGGGGEGRRIKVIDLLSFPRDLGSLPYILRIYTMTKRVCISKIVQIRNILFFFLVIKVMYIYVSTKLLQLCPTMCNPMDCSLPGSSVHGILQARILELVAMSSSRESP